MNSKFESCNNNNNNNNKSSNSPDVSRPGNRHDEEGHQINGDLGRQQELHTFLQLLQTTSTLRFHISQPKIFYNITQNSLSIILLYSFYIAGNTVCQPLLFIYHYNISLRTWLQFLVFCFKFFCSILLKFILGLLQVLPRYLPFLCVQQVISVNK